MFFYVVHTNADQDIQTEDLEAKIAYLKKPNDKLAKKNQAMKTIFTPRQIIEKLLINM